MATYYKTPEQALQAAIKNAKDTVNYSRCSEALALNTGEIYVGVDIEGNHTFNVKSTYPTLQSAMSMTKEYVIYYPVR